eukprot:6492552-Amphidinium_carterae.2
MVDSCAAVHACPPSYGTASHGEALPELLEAANGATVSSYGHRECTYQLPAGGGERTVKFVGCDVKHEMLSLAQLVSDWNVDIHFTQARGGYIEFPDGSVVPLVKKNNVYWLDVTEQGLPMAGFGRSSGSRDAMTDATHDATHPEVVVTDEVETGEERGRVPRAKKVPLDPTVDELRRHCTTHLPRRPWCVHCVRGAGVDDSHWRRSTDPNRLPEWQLDYAFLTQAGVEVTSTHTTEHITILNAINVETGYQMALVCDKSTSEYIVGAVCQVIGEVGHTKIIMRSDAEHAIQSLCKAVKAARSPLETILEAAPVGSHQSVGSIERANRTLGEQVRVVRSQLEVHLCATVPLQHVLVVWLVRHCAWLICRYLIKTDGRTAFERAKMKKYSGEIVEFGEQVLFHHNKGFKWDYRFHPGIWLGKTTKADEHLVWDGAEVRRTRTLQRQAEGSRWKPDAMLGVRALPWKLRPDPVTGMPPPGAKRMYITKWWTNKYGATPGCAACSGAGPSHSEECRQRFESIVAENQRKGREDAANRAAVRAMGENIMATEGAREHPEAADEARMHVDGGTQPLEEIGTALAVPTPPVEIGTALAVPSVPMQTGAETRPLEEASAASTEPESKRARVINGLMVCCSTPVICSIQEGLADESDQGEEFSYTDTGAIRAPRPSRVVCDEKTGQTLPSDQVQVARQKEMDNLRRHDVLDVLTVDEARLRERQGGVRAKRITARFVDTMKETADGAIVRSRLVAQEFNWMGNREDISQSTPGRKAFKFVVSFAATRFLGVDSERGHRKHLFVWDISVAFMHARRPADEIIFVQPPKGYAPKGSLWHLRGAMNGTRAASQAWGTHVTRVMVDLGGKELQIFPMMFWFEQQRILLAVHGDDFLGAGNWESLLWLDGAISSRFDCKCIAKIGQEGVHEGRILKRTVRWRPEGFSWEADAEHAKAVSNKMGLKGNTKGSSVPGSKASGTGMANADDLLEVERVAVYRSVAGTLLYLSLDRPDLQFSMSRIMSGMQAPTESDWCRLKLAARYVHSRPRMELLFNYQDMGPTMNIDVFVDSDYAGSEARKSTDCVHEFHGCHLVESSTCQQQLIALSTGEAEYYALVRGSACGLQDKHFLEGLGCEATLRVHSDSSAARGFANKTGLGKRMKHIQVRFLWLQQLVRDRALKLCPVDTLLNSADLGTKHHPASRLEVLLSLLPLVFSELPGASAEVHEQDGTCHTRDGVDLTRASMSLCVGCCVVCDVCCMHWHDDMLRSANTRGSCRGGA